MIEAAKRHNTGIEGNSPNISDTTMDDFLSLLLCSFSPTNNTTTLHLSRRAKRTVIIRLKNLSHHLASALAEHVCIFFGRDLPLDKWFGEKKGRGVFPVYIGDYYYPGSLHWGRRSGLCGCLRRCRVALQM